MVDRDGQRRRLGGVVGDIGVIDNGALHTRGSTAAGSRVVALGHGGVCGRRRKWVTRRCRLRPAPGAGHVALVDRDRLDHGLRVGGRNGDVVDDVDVAGDGPTPAVAGAVALVNRGRELIGGRRRRGAGEGRGAALAAPWHSSTVTVELVSPVPRLRLLVTVVEHDTAWPPTLSGAVALIDGGPGGRCGGRNRLRKRGRSQLRGDCSREHRALDRGRHRLRRRLSLGTGVSTNVDMAGAAATATGAGWGLDSIKVAGMATSATGAGSGVDSIVASGRPTSATGAGSGLGSIAASGRTTSATGPARGSTRSRRPAGRGRRLESNQRRAPTASRWTRSPGQWNRPGASGSARTRGRRTACPRTDR